MYDYLGQGLNFISSLEGSLPTNIYEWRKDEIFGRYLKKKKKKERKKETPLFILIQIIVQK